MVSIKTINGILLVMTKFMLDKKSIPQLVNFWKQFRQKQ